jgi:hypothetical protein
MLLKGSRYGAQVVSLLQKLQQEHELTYLLLVESRSRLERYVQPINASVQQAVNSPTAAVLDGFVAPVADMGLEGRNFKRPEAIRRSC